VADKNQVAAADEAVAGPARPTGAVSVRTENLSSSYCNVCMANSTREEVVLTFGLNQDWDRKGAQLEIALLKRIILSPHGAKRFSQRLAQVLTEYEKRYGELSG
jgi:hypothetical protein